MKKLLFLYILLIIPLFAIAQFGDHFDDGNINADPEWIVNNGIYIVNSEGEMQLNDTIGGTSFVYTNVNIADSTLWEFYFRMEFAPSNSNRLRVFLSANSNDFNSDLNGYFIEIGESGSLDKITLNRLDGATETILAQSLDGSAENNPTIRVRIKRDQMGTWDLSADFSGGFDFVPFANVVDNTYPTGQFFGFQCFYTDSRKDNFFFDDILIDSLEVDLEPPMMVSATPITAEQIDVVFNEDLNPLTLNNNQFTLDNGVNVLSATLDGSDPTLVHLTVSPLTSGLTYNLTSIGVEDLAENPSISASVSFFFFQAAQAELADILINEIFADFTPVVGLPEGEFIELFNRSDKTFDLENYTFSDASSSVSLPSYIFVPNTYVILCNDEDFAAYQALGPTINVGSLPGLNNSGDDISITNAFGTIVDDVSYLDQWYQDNEKDDGGYSLELRNPNLYCQGADNWTASNDFSGGTPGRQNSVFQNFDDNTPPEIIGALPITNQEVLLSFDEIMDEASVTDIGNYMIQPLIEDLISIELQANEKSVILLFNNAFQDQTTYTITLNNVSDCVGNVIEAENTTNFTFFITQDAEQYDIIINEIYPDVTPSLGFPEIKYLELFNRSDKAINLENYTMDEGSANPSPFPFFVLNPGQYVILQKTNFLLNYNAFGDVIFLDAFNLTIGGEPLILLDPTGQIIDAVIYSSTWHDEGRDDGGFSLERIDPSKVCDLTNNNWATSNAAFGGTPGSVNSTHPTPEELPLELLKTYVANEQPNVLELTFNKALDRENAINLDNYLITPAGLTIQDIEIVGPYFDRINILFTAPIPAQTIYDISISGITDCQNLMLSTSSNIGQFALSELPEPNDIVINEVLHNPASGGSRFVELFNRSSKVLNSQDFLFAKRDENGQLTDLTEILIPCLIFPGTHIVFTPSPFDIQSRYTVLNPNSFVLTSLPTFDNTEDAVVLLTAGSVIIDELQYTRSFHNALLDDLNGVSLERIDPEGNTQEEGNWHSAAATVGFATPTFQNSQFFEVVNPGSEIISIPIKTISPNGDGFQDVLLINYQTDRPGFLAKVDIFDAKGRLIRQLAKSELIASNGNIKWDGTIDDGSKARIGIYIVFVELTNPDGTIERVKETVVVAGNLK